MTTIKEYKEKLVAIVEEMEKEHGVSVKSVTISKECEHSFPAWPQSYQVTELKVDIEL